MPSDKRSLRVLLEPSDEREVIAISKQEGRSLASVCSRLIQAALYQRRASEKQTSALVQMIRGQADFSPDNAA